MAFIYKKMRTVLFFIHTACHTLHQRGIKIELKGKGFKRGGPISGWSY